MAKFSVEREGAAAGGSSQRMSKRTTFVPDGEENRLRSEDRVDEPNDSVEAVDTNHSRELAGVDEHASVSAPAGKIYDSFVLTDPRVLDCTICYETLTIPVFQCVNGHIACSNCCTRVKKKCPSCSCLIGDNRCRAIEKVIESVKVSCMFSEYGCKEKLSLVGKKDHEESCIHQPFKCPFDSCCIKISLCQFWQHCNDIHDALRVRIIECNCLIPISLDKYRKTIILAEEMVDAVFFLNNDVVSDGNMIRVRLVGPVKREFTYELTARQDVNTLRLQSSMELHTAAASHFLLVPHGFFNHSNLLKMELRINFSKRSWCEEALSSNQEFCMEGTGISTDESATKSMEPSSQQVAETRDEMLSRHRKEIALLQNKEIGMKIAAAKGSKAEQKAKKKQVDEEISKLSDEMKKKHAREFASIGYSDTNGKDESGMENIVKAIAGVSVTNQVQQAKPRKNAKRREKRAQEEAAREQRIIEEKSNTVSDGFIENQLLEKKLQPLGLTVYEIKPDGHCMYRAVEDQLARISGGSSPYTFQELRGMVASYMRKHASDILPFFLSENEIEDDSESSIAEKFETYCKEVESTAAWGGQLELGALTHCLKKHIKIFSGSFPDVEMGSEYKPKGAVSRSSILLSYHRHAFGLGEHYNSVVPTSVR